MNLNDKKIFEIFSKYFNILKKGYIIEYLIIKVNYVVFYIK